MRGRLLRLDTCWELGWGRVGVGVGDWENGFRV